MKSYKQIIILFAVVFLLTGCINNKNVEFCEGVSTDGKGVKCGEKFSTGDVTLLIKSKAPFGSEKIALNILKKDAYKSEKIETQTINVVPEAFTVKTNYYFYDEGDFIVEVRDGSGNKIAQGNIQVIDEY
jgi:hypothetical protein